MFSVEKMKCAALVWWVVDPLAAITGTLVGLSFPPSAHAFHEKTIPLLPWVHWMMTAKTLGIWIEYNAAWAALASSRSLNGLWQHNLHFATLVITQDCFARRGKEFSSPAGTTNCHPKKHQPKGYSRLTRKSFHFQSHLLTRRVTVVVMK